MGGGGVVRCRLLFSTKKFIENQPSKRRGRRQVVEGGSRKSTWLMDNPLFDYDLSTICGGEKVFALISRESSTIRYVKDT